MLILQYPHRKGQPVHTKILSWANNVCSPVTPSISSPKLDKLWTCRCFSFLHALHVPVHPARNKWALIMVGLTLIYGQIIIYNIDEYICIHMYMYVFIDIIYIYILIQWYIPIWCMYICMYVCMYVRYIYLIYHFMP